MHEFISELYISGVNLRIVGKAKVGWSDNNADTNWGAEEYYLNTEIALPGTC